MKTNILKLKFLFLLLGFSLSSASLNAQTGNCTFVSPTVALNSSSVGANGTCIVNMDLSFVLTTNNGNKWIILHLWPENAYPNPHHPYAVNNPPKSNQLPGNNSSLNTAVLTLIINKFGPIPFLESVYSPDPTIDDNIAPAINQVQDATNGLTVTVTNLGNGTAFYSIKNVTITYPGACNSIVSFKGDAWASNASSLNVQCSMVGFSYLSNAPLITANIQCAPLGDPNSYEFGVSVTAPNYDVDFSMNIYADDDSNGVYNPLVDTIVIASYSAANTPNVTSNSPYFSSQLPYSYSSTAPNKYKGLFFVASDIVVTDLTTSLATSYGNEILYALDNNCFQILPVTLKTFDAERRDDKVFVSWSAHESADITGYELQRSTDKITWNTVTSIAAKGYGLNQLSQYQAWDNNMESKTVLYRLKMKSSAKGDTYSRTITVAGMNEGFSYTVNSNPSTDGAIHFSLSTNSATASVGVTDMQGRVMKSMSNASSGTYSINNLQPGIYVLSIRNNSSQETTHERIVIKD